MHGPGWKSSEAYLEALLHWQLAWIDPMKNPKAIHIGTSGWHYAHWKGLFYPKNLSSHKFLEYYAERFHTVEINSSFYRLPDEKSLRSWYDSVPEEFIFAVKASRYITHMKKLNDPEPALSLLLKRIEALKEKLGPILFQLPPNWKINAGRLKSFVETLPIEHTYVFEFRDASWFDASIYEILEEHGAAFCIYHLAGVFSPGQATANTVYVRLHGPGRAYQGQYDSQALSDWARAFSTWTRQGSEVYCYFDNDEAAYAPQDALRLESLIQQQESIRK